MQIVTRTLQTVSQSLNFSWQKLKHIDSRIVGVVAVVFAATVIYTGYQKLLKNFQAFRDSRQEHRQKLIAEHSALLAERKRLDSTLIPNLDAIKEETRAAICEHLRPVAVEEGAYVYTIGDDNKKLGRKLPKYIADIFNHGEEWIYGTIKVQNNPLVVYDWLSKDVGTQEKAIRCLNVCSQSAWKPTLHPLLLAEPDLNEVSIKEQNVITFENHKFKVVTALRSFLKDEQINYIIRSVEFDVRELDNADGSLPSLNVNIIYSKGL